MFRHLPRFVGFVIFTTFLANLSAWAAEWRKCGDNYPLSGPGSTCGTSTGCDGCGTCATCPSTSSSGNSLYPRLPLMESCGGNGFAMWYSQGCTTTSQGWQCKTLPNSSYRHLAGWYGGLRDCQYCEDQSATNSNPDNYTSTRYPVFNERMWLAEGETELFSDNVVNKIYEPNYTGNAVFTNCAPCPSNLEAAGVASCSYNGFTCRVNHTKTWVENGVSDPLYSNRSVNSYACVCENSTDIYQGWNGACGSCENPSAEVGRKTCTSSGYTCENFAYRGTYGVNDGVSSIDSRRGTYYCISCPRITNATTFDSSAGDSVADTSKWTWSSTDRCYATSTRVFTETSVVRDYTFLTGGDNNTAISGNPGCRYKWEIQPTSSCAGTTAHGSSGVVFSREATPDPGNMDLTGGCNYAGRKVYTYAPPGYYLYDLVLGASTTYNGMTLTHISVCVQCPDGKYSTGGTNTSCTDVPANAIANSDRTGFDCAKGYYKYTPTAFSGDPYCVKCPCYRPTDTDSDPVDDARPSNGCYEGTTAGAGATSIMACYVDSYGNYASDSDSTGSYISGCQFDLRWADGVSVLMPQDSVCKSLCMQITCNNQNNYGSCDGNGAPCDTYGQYLYLNRFGAGVSLGEAQALAREAYYTTQSSGSGSCFLAGTWAD